jgi:hypothetical protein
LKRKAKYKRMTAKERVTRSKQRLRLSKKLSLWQQRVKDVEVERLLGKPKAAQRAEFVRQELAKAEKEMRSLNAGAKRQRDWASGISKM